MCAKGPLLGRGHRTWTLASYTARKEWGVRKREGDEASPRVVLGACTLGEPEIEAGIAEGNHSKGGYVLGYSHTELDVMSARPSWRPSH